MRRPWAAGLLVCAVVAGRGLGQDDFATLYARAEQLRGAGQAEEAVVRRAYGRALRAFLKISPSAVGYRRWLPSAAHTAWQAGRAELAANLFDQALGAGQPTAFLVVGRLRALVASGATETALREARGFDADCAREIGAFLLEPDIYRPVRDEVARLLRRGERDLVLWFERAIVRASGEQVFALANLALTLRFVGELEESRRLYDRAFEIAPDDLLLWNDFGLLLKGTGHPAQARKAFLESLSLESDPGTGPATTNLLLLERNGIDPGISDPAAALARRLRQEGDLPRRLCIDRLVRR